MISRKHPIQTISALTGYTLAFPYIVFLVPWPYWAPLLAPIPVLSVLIISTYKKCLLRMIINPAISKADYLILSVLIANTIAILVGIANSDSAFFSSVYREFLIGTAVVVMFFGVMVFNVYGKVDPSLILRAFLLTASGVSIVSAVAGVAKLLLADDGMYLPIIIQAYPDFYPWGTSIKSDYNFFGLALLSGALSIYMLLINSNRNYNAYILAVLLIGFLCATALNSGSRRVIVTSALVLGLLLIREIFFRKAEGARPLQNLAVLGCAAVVAVALNASRPYVDLPGTDFLVENDLVLPRQEAEQLALSIIADRDKVTPPTAQPEAPKVVQPTGMPFTLDVDVSSRIDAAIDPEAGLSGRIVMWKHAIELAREMNIFRGMGFDYQRIFSCTYSGCRVLDYPHNQILSHFLFAGIFGLIACVMFFAIYSIVCLALLGGTFHYPIGLMLTANLAFSLISFDTLYGNPAFFTLFLLGWLIFQRDAIRNSFKARWLS